MLAELVEYVRHWFVDLPVGGARLEGIVGVEDLELEDGAARTDWPSPRVFDATFPGANCLLQTSELRLP